MTELPIEALIPQRPPFVLVDRIVEVTENGISSEFFIDPSHCLVENGKLSAYGLLENIAQTAALLSGYDAVSSGQEPKTGFIGSVSGSTIHYLPAENSRLKTFVQRTTQILNVIVIEGKAYVNDIECASSTMKIVLID